MSDLIKHFESCKLEAYKDSGGTVTIGWGHTKGVRMGDICNQAQADKWLEEDLVDAENRVKRMFPNPMPKNEWDALVSLAYNLASFEVLARHLLKDRERFKEKILLYYRTPGSERGLKRRRIAERLLFEGREWLSVSNELEKASLEQMKQKEKELFYA